MLSVLQRTAFFFVAAMGLIAVMFTVSGDLLLVRLLDDDYAGLGRPMALLAWGLLAASLGMTAGNGIWGDRSTRA